MTSESAANHNQAATPPFVRCGKIHFGGSHFRIPCVVKALTKETAHLRVFGPEKLPERFWLTVEMHQIERECEVVARSEKHVTVKFCSEADGPAEADRDQDREARELPGRSQVSQRTAEKSGQPPRLWVVDDDDDDCRLLCEAFQERSGLCDLSFFKDGWEFLNYLKSGDHAAGRGSSTVVLLDLNMPRMDGVTALEKMRSDERFRHLPVIIFTTSNSEEDIRKTYALGVSAYITKPSTQVELDRAVDFISSYWDGAVRVPTV